MSVAQNDRFTFFGSYAESMRMLDDADLAALVRGMCAYAFEGVEPEFSEAPLCFIWPLIRPNIDSSIKAAAAGRKTPRETPRKTPQQTPQKTPAETPTETPRETPQKTPSDTSEESQTDPSEAPLPMDMDREVDRDMDRELDREVDEGPRSGKPDRRRTAEVSEVIDYLNAKTGRKFRMVESNARHVRARLAEGYTVADCKRVVDLKAAEWLEGESGDGRDMSVYLRPETLFGAKFDSYLNSAPASPPRRGPRISLVTGEPIPEDGPSPVRWGDAL